MLETDILPTEMRQRANADWSASTRTEDLGPDQSDDRVNCNDRGAAFSQQTRGVESRVIDKRATFVQDPDERRRMKSTSLGDSEESRDLASRVVLSEQRRGRQLKNQHTRGCNSRECSHQNRSARILLCQSIRTEIECPQPEKHDDGGNMALAEAAICDPVFSPEYL